MEAWSPIIMSSREYPNEMVLSPTATAFFSLTYSPECDTIVKTKQGGEAYVYRWLGTSC